MPDNESPHVLRIINEFNIPTRYEILYFGANLILIFDYKFTFGTKIRSSDDDNRIEVIIISIKGSSLEK